MYLFKLIWNILDRSEKIKFYFYIILSILNTFLETSIVLMIVPLTQILMQKEVNLFIFENTEFLEDFSYPTLVVASVSLLTLGYILKNLYVIFFLWWTNKYIGDFQRRVTKTLFSNYIYQSYSYHVNKSSGLLINILNNEVGTFKSTLKSICTICSESLILITLIIILFLFQPEGILSLIIFALTSFFLINFFLKNKLREWGKKRFIYANQSNSEIVQSFEGIKEIKMLKVENNIVNKFYDKIYNMVSYLVIADVATNLPKIIYEIITVCCFCLLILVLLITSNSYDNIILYTALFTAVAFRIMPSLTRITLAFTTFQNQFTPINRIINDLNLEYKEFNYSQTSKSISFENNIKIENLYFKHPSNTKFTIENVNIEIDKGDIIGITGESGSGKTTFADIFVGLLDPTNGKIIIDNKKLDDSNLVAWQKNIGYVSQNVYLSDDTIRNNIAFGVDENKIDNKRVKKCIELCNLSDFVKNLPNGLDTITGERGLKISGGQKQRLTIARAIYFNPDIIVFDEATSALDKKNENEIISNIVNLSRKENKTLIIIAHKLSILNNCTKLIVFDSGKISIKDTKK